MIRSENACVLDTSSHTKATSFLNTNQVGLQRLNYYLQFITSQKHTFNFSTYDQKNWTGCGLFLEATIHGGSHYPQLLNSYKTTNKV